MIKRMIIMLFLCLLVLGGIFGFKLFGKTMMMQAMAARANPVYTVSTMLAKKETWQSELRVVGSLRAVKGVDIAPEKAGTAREVPVESGKDVKEGDVLLKMNDDEEVAALLSIRAQKKLALITLERDKKLLKVKGISQAVYDNAVAAADQLDAQELVQLSTISKKTLTAPFDGRVGLRQVDVGEYLAAGQTVVTLQQLDPIYLDFSVPQQALAFLKPEQLVAAKTDVFPDTFEGTLTAINAKVDENTRNVEVRAMFKNPDKKLLPGMFATATLTYGEQKDLITIPQTAITFNPYGSTVYTVQKDDKGQNIAHMTLIKTGETRGDQIAILDGLKEGDEVITSGQMKLQNGALISINNTVQPANDPNPEPQDE